MREFDSSTHFPNLNLTSGHNALCEFDEVGERNISSANSLTIEGGVCPTLYNTIQSMGQIKSKHRVTIQVSDLGWVDLVL